MLILLVLSFLLTDILAKHHAPMNDSDYGQSLNLRPVEKRETTRNQSCRKRARDGKWVCHPDVFYIGTSKSGTTSMAHYLANHPSVRNILSPEIQISRRSKEGHFWEKSISSEMQFGDKLNMSWIASRLVDIDDVQEGFDSIEERPLLIDYTPNYFVLDHIPLSLSLAYPPPHNLKFIVSLREPLARAISSWKFKATEFYNMKRANPDKNFYPDALFNISMMVGMESGRCIALCLKETRDIQGCSIKKCRLRAETRGDGRYGGYSYCAHVMKSLYAYQFLLWFSYFRKEQFFVFTMEDLMKSPIGTFERLLDFLGLPLYDSTGKHGFTDRKALIRVLSVVKNETPTKKVGGLHARIVYSHTSHTHRTTLLTSRAWRSKSNPRILKSSRSSSPLTTTC